MGTELSKFRVKMGNFMMCTKIYNFVHFGMHGIKNNFMWVLFTFKRICGFQKNSCSKKNDENVENSTSTKLLNANMNSLQETQQDGNINEKNIDAFERENRNFTETTTNSEIDIIIKNQDHTTMEKSIVIHNLKVLVNLADGQKPWLSYNKLEVYSSYSSWIPGMRWMYSQSRSTIIPCIKDTVINGIIFKKNNDKEIGDLLIFSVSGLEKLKITYDTDHKDIDDLILLIKH